ncbi:MAG: hypothetical protein LAN63_00155 [Acidobacteriia bacterium]|nr:hypothetical protein [Terriglobia bacterium]
MRHRAASLLLDFAILGTTVVATQSARAQTFTVLYSFTATAGDGALPTSVILDAAGNLYGTTNSGGSDFKDCPDGCGTVFKLDTTGTETILYSFGTRKGGADPFAGVIRDGAGNLYGTTESGGAANEGAVYKLDTAGTLTQLHSFHRSRDGVGPSASLIRDAAGNLYGTTFSGGNSTHCFGGGCGTVFKLDPTGKETILHSFGGADGVNPDAALLRDADGNLYGSTVHGGNPACTISGNHGCGVIFKVAPTGPDTVLYSFTGEPDGQYPVTSLIRDAAGNLYGTTTAGGASGACLTSQGCGTVFELDPSGKETVLYSFTGTPDGASPYGGLIRDREGNFYGTTRGGGAYGYGTVFKLDTAGRETVLYSFAGGTDGAYPNSTLVRDAAGNLYGTTNFGGDLSCLGGWSCGAVFKITP